MCLRVNPNPQTVGNDDDALTTARIDADASNGGRLRASMAHRRPQWIVEEAGNGDWREDFRLIAHRPEFTRT
jgi:hypothetical protein